MQTKSDLSSKTWVEISKSKLRSKEISIDYLADKVGTINYEVVSRINQNILRVVV